MPGDGCAVSISRRRRCRQERRRGDVSGTTAARWRRREHRRDSGNEDRDSVVAVGMVGAVVTAARAWRGRDSGRSLLQTLLAFQDKCTIGHGSGFINPVKPLLTRWEPDPVAGGATATVHRGTCDGERVAVKIARTPPAAAWLAEEAWCLAWVDHPHVASLVDAGVDGEGASAKPYLVLRWAPGVPLADMTQGAGARSRAAVVARDVGRALESLEALGVAHGDVKPANVLFAAEPSGSATLVDFGLGGAASADRVEGGTPRYLAPEVRAGAVVERRYVDRYAFGVVLAEMLSARAASASDPAGVFRRSALASPLAEVVRSLLGTVPTTRPRPGYVADVASEFAPDGGRGEADASLVRMAYVRLRRDALARAAWRPSVSLADDLAPWVVAIVRKLRAAARLLGAFSPVTNAERSWYGRDETADGAVGAPPGPAKPRRCRRRARLRRRHCAGARAAAWLRRVRQTRMPPADARPRSRRRRVRR